MRTGFADFLAGRTAFVSQKSALDYCRARAGIGWTQLFREDEFGRALERCRWESYRGGAGRRRRGGADLPAPAAAVRDRTSPRGWAGPCALRWSDTPSPGIGRIGTRPAIQRAGAPASRAARTAAAGAPGREQFCERKVFDVLPIHTNLKAHDREMVVNNVRFLLCRVYADMEARARRPGTGAGAQRPTGDELQPGPR